MTRLAVALLAALLQPGFPNGMLVMNSSPKYFLIFDWRAVAKAVPPKDGR